MLNSIKLFISNIKNNNKKSIALGRWHIKHEVDKCNEYMLKMHADPGYIVTYKIKKK